MTGIVSEVALFVKIKLRLWKQSDNPPCSYAVQLLGYDKRLAVKGQEVPICTNSEA